MPAKLCVNIDHVATVRNARGEGEPDPIHAAVLCEMAGAVGITVHLREDRRHIVDRDLPLLKEVVKGLLNLEMACTNEMVGIAMKLHPDQVTLVPEKRAEVTTEGGLDVRRNFKAVRAATKKLLGAGIAVSHFIDPDAKQVDASAESGASHVEFHTGAYAQLFDRKRDAAMKERERLRAACEQAHALGMIVNAGHGLNYRNVEPIASLPHMNELNIGHAIVGRAIFVGLDRAVGDMIRLLRRARTA
ncbi:pyridoxine 5'-phosphate synthase [Candidatus Sumerlaeota bacterium]|nr:pyridoxine 5'-phosphate synthase [Candidatus Sumerlaeota bacterium]HMZ51227.1 pyridoxine 5'-phosphate synthase [Candidatus Sumerlaeota bacterium]